MGLTYSKLVVKSPRRPDLQPVEVEALADSEALHLCVPPTSTSNSAWKRA